MIDLDLDVARRAIAAGARWMPGMRTTTGLIVIAAGDHSARVCDADDCVLDIVETAHLLPDVNVPATKGCLLAQVRERWGDAGATTCFNNIGCWGKDRMGLHCRARHQRVLRPHRSRCACRSLGSAQGMTATVYPGHWKVPMNACRVGSVLLLIVLASCGCGSRPLAEVCVEACTEHNHSQGKAGPMDATCFQKCMAASLPKCVSPTEAPLD